MPKIDLKAIQLPGYSQALDLSLNITRLDFLPDGSVMASWEIRPAGTKTKVTDSGIVNIPQLPDYVPAAHQKLLEDTYAVLLKSYVAKLAA